MLAQHQGLLCSSLCPDSEETGGGKRRGEDKVRTADPNGPRGYSTPYDVIVSNRTRGVLGVLQSRRGNPLIKLSLSQLMRFFFLTFVLPHPTGEQVTGWRLPHGVTPPDKHTENRLVCACEVSGA